MMIQIKFDDGTLIECISAIASKMDQRDIITITLNSTYTEVADKFVDDIEWYIVNTSTVEEITTINTYDKSEYSEAMDITDHRDGTISVIMGKPTSDELLAMIEGVM